jgi:imidazolonepropionase-like amidohydrolase
MKNILLYTLLMISFFSFSQKKALVGGTLIDGYGNVPIHDSVILIEDETIIEVGTTSTIEISSDYEIISTEGMSVMPGLWDMHVHLMINGHSDYDYWDKTYSKLFKDVIMPSSAHQLLMAGVTSARDLGGPLDESIAVRDKINIGEIPGPTMYVSGPFIQKKPYPGTEQFRWGVNGERDARNKIKTLANAGVDVIKLIDQDQMTYEELSAIVDEAHINNLKVVAHSHRPEEIRLGLRAGIDNFEHTGLSSAPKYPDDIIEMINERTGQMNIGPLFWTPTIEGLYNYTDIIKSNEHLDNDSWHLGLPDSIITDIKKSILKPGELPYFQLTPIRKPTLKTKFNQLRNSGVVMMIGTDSGIPMKFHSQSTWNELDVWVNIMDVDPLDAIKSATYWPSFFMGVSDKVGTITVGKQADIIAVKGNVLKYISLLQNVDLVIKKGEVIKIYKN